MKQVNVASLKRILISRTDSIGDVVLTLPICVWLKRKFPEIQIVFLGRTYTEPVISCISEIDEIVDWSILEKMHTHEQVKYLSDLNIDAIIHVFPKKEIAKLAKKANIRNRIGTSHRLFHWFSCTILPSFSRKKSDLHESQLNFELVKPFGLTTIPSLNEITNLLSGFNVPQKEELPEDIQLILNQSSKTIILHPKSQGSAVEWGMDNFIHLTKILVEKNYTIFYTGTEQEGKSFRSQLIDSKNVIDTTGKLNLNQLLLLISKVQTLVACSTGPFHLAGVLGIQAIGLFSPRKPIHPGRWKAIGNKVTPLVYDTECENCKKNVPCDCIQKISPTRIVECLES
jgi:heptosyltransferase-3